MGSECFGLYWEGIANSECTKGKGCAKLNECLAKFATTTLADYQRELGPKDAIPEKLGLKASVQPEAILLAMNFQKNTQFNPFVVVDEPVKATRTVVEYAGEETELEEIPEEDMSEELFDELAEESVEELEAEPVKKPKGKTAQKAKSKQQSEQVAEGGEIDSAQFCKACRGTGKRGRGNCKACSGTGKAMDEAQTQSAERSAVQAEVVTRAEKKPVSRQAKTRHENKAVVAGGDPRGNSQVGVLHVQGGEVPNAILSSGRDSGDEGFAQTNRPPWETPRGETTGGNEAVDGVVGPKIFPPSFANRGMEEAGQKRQVVVDLYNKRMVTVNWPEYPTLMETPNEKIVQLVAWDVSRRGWTKLVPALSGDPDEILFKSLFRS